MEKRLEALKEDYDSIPVPKEALARIKKGINAAKEENKTTPINKYRKQKRFAAGFAAAFAVCLLAANSTATVSNAMGNIPVIGGFFRVITLRHFEKDDGKLQISADTPEIQSDSSKAAKIVNRDSSEYIEDLLAQFEEDYEGGFQSLDISYNVITDSEKYFSLDIYAVDTGASAYEFHSFYTIDKEKDHVVALSDLFNEGADYVTPISNEIINQMKADTKTDYFIGEEEDGFIEIDPHQSFYINNDGNIVICFEEYQVGPGSIGAPQFIIPSSVTDSI